jgi:hypothetical protein
VVRLANSGQELAGYKIGFVLHPMAMERWQTIWIVTAAVLTVTTLAFYGVLVYLTFGRVLIPLARSLCNFLDAQAWHVDHQYKTRPGLRISRPTLDLCPRSNLFEREKTPQIAGFRDPRF